MSFINHTTPANLVPKGYEQLTSVSSSTALTIPAGASLAYISADTQDARWRDDPVTVAPTASVGQLLKAGFNPTPFIGDLSKLRFIQVAAGLILNVTYYATSGN